MTAVLSDYLRHFNRKERFFLVGWSLGNRDFRRSVSSAINLAVPSEAFAAIDYHWDWLYASVLATSGEAGAVHANGDGLVSGNQEDIDLLIASRAEGTWHVTMIEAKGVTRWLTNCVSAIRRMSTPQPQRTAAFPFLELAFQGP